jgi:hypothetical protein
VELEDVEAGFRTLGLLSQRLLESQEKQQGPNSTINFPVESLEGVARSLLDSFGNSDPSSFSQDFGELAVYFDGTGGRNSSDGRQEWSPEDRSEYVVRLPFGPNNGSITFGSFVFDASDVVNATGGRPVSGLFTLFFDGANVSESRQVEIVIPVLPSNLTGQLVCVFLDTNTESWSTAGVTTVSSGDGKVVCRSVHLSSFSVIVNGDAPRGANSEALRIITYIGLSLSLFCLLLIMVTFIAFKSLRKQSQRILLNLAAALFAAQLLFIAGVDEASGNRAACQVCA